MSGYVAALSEREFQTMITDAARLCGLATYHTFDSRRSQKGFPDLVIVGATGVLFRELKTAKGVLSVDQKRWLRILSDVGEDARVWRPDQWPAVIMAELRGLGSLADETTSRAEKATARRIVLQQKGHW